MVVKTTIHGHNLKYESEDKVDNGLRYLRDDLQTEESKVFFDQAREKGSAQFEGDNEEQYTIIYSKDGYYTLLRRQS